MDKNVFALRCDMWLMLLYSSKPFNYCAEPQNLKWKMAQLHAVASSVYSVLYSWLYSLQHSLTSHLPWLWPSVQMANGQRASRQLSKSMSYSWAGGGTMPLVTHHVRNTLWPVHQVLFRILPENPFSLTESPVTFSLYLLLCPHPA